jgi:Flp pilus assembly protein CpaB
MADFAGKSDATFTPLTAASTKKTGPSVSSSWVLMVLSGLIAMVVFLFATAKSDPKVEILVAANNIQTGSQVQASDFRTEAVALDTSQLNRFIRAADRNSVVGFTASGPISAGDFIAKNQLRQAATNNGLSAMSIPVDPTHAAGGNLARGDRVDIIDESTAAFVARNIEVIDVKNGSAGGALSSGQQFHVVVALNSDTALSIGGALKNGKFDIIRSTGGTGNTQ